MTEQEIQGLRARVAALERTVAGLVAANKDSAARKAKEVADERARQRFQEDLMAEFSDPNQRSFQMSIFKSIEARKRYEHRVAIVIQEAMLADIDMRYEAIVEGRIGLAEMSEQDLLEIGQSCWKVDPQGELK